MRVRCFAHTARARTQTSRSAVQRKNQSAITSGTADPLVYRFSHTRQVIHRCELHQEKNTAFFCNHTKLKSHLSGRNDPRMQLIAMVQQLCLPTRLLPRLRYTQVNKALLLCFWEWAEGKSSPVKTYLRSLHIVQIFRPENVCPRERQLGV